MCDWTNNTSKNNIQKINFCRKNVWNGQVIALITNKSQVFTFINYNKSKNRDNFDKKDIILSKKETLILSKKHWNCQKLSIIKRHLFWLMHRILDKFKIEQTNISKKNNVQKINGCQKIANWNEQSCCFNNTTNKDTNFT